MNCCSLARRVQAGFTFIKLIVTVLVLGIFGTLALPTYQDYTARAQVTAAMSEITPAKNSIEEKLAQGVTITEAIALSGVTDNITSLLGIKASNICTTMATSVAVDGFSAVTCTISGSLQVTGKKIRWTRSADSAGVMGVWSCITDVNVKLVPKTCVVDTIA